MPGGTGPWQPRHRGNTLTKHDLDAIAMATGCTLEVTWVTIWCHGYHMLSHVITCYHILSHVVTCYHMLSHVITRALEAFDSDIEDPEVLASMRPPEPEQELQDGAQEPSRRFGKNLTVLDGFETHFLRTANIVAGPLGRGWN